MAERYNFSKDEMDEILADVSQKEEQLTKARQHVAHLQRKKTENQLFHEQSQQNYR